jgi:hypothetical protein
LCQQGVLAYNEQMNTSRLQCLLLGLVTSSFGATAVPAAHAAFPIGLRKGADGTHLDPSEPGI